MTTYSQRQELEQKSQALAKKLAIWQGVENAWLVLAGIAALWLMFTAYKGG